MNKDWKELPESSKVWVYQASDFLTEEQQKTITEKGKQFIDKWESHGTPIPASIQVIDNLFIVISADDCGENLCGRAKDAQMKLMKALEEQLKIELTNRMMMAYEENGEIKILSFEEFKKQAREGGVTPETIVFDNLVETKKDFKERWRTSAKNSWHNRFLTPRHVEL